MRVRRVVFTMLSPRLYQKMLNLLLAIFIGLIAAQPVSAQEVIWVTVEGTSPVTARNQAEARLQAIENAERTAVAEALSPGITIETLLVNLRLSGSILGVIPYGKVLNKEILEEGPVESVADDSTNPGLLYRVRIKAGVVQEISGEDPSFYLDAAINQSVFKDEDELEIHIRSTRDCHLAIFNILEDKKVIRLLPNYLSGKTFLTADQNYTFPEKQDRRKGLKLRVHIPENKNVVTESIYILALPHPFKLASIDMQEGIFGVFNGQTAFMKDLIGAVVSIPLGDRAEALLQYEIRKNKKGV